MLETFSKQLWRQPLRFAHGLIAVLAVAHDLWQRVDFRDPSAVAFRSNLVVKVISINGTDSRPERYGTQPHQDSPYNPPVKSGLTRSPALPWCPKSFDGRSPAAYRIEVG